MYLLPLSWLPLCFVGLFFLKKIFIYLFLERREGREKVREGNIDVWEKHWSVASRIPPPGSWPAPSAQALTGKWTSDLLVCRRMPNSLSHISQGCCWFLLLCRNFLVWCSLIHLFLLLLSLPLGSNSWLISIKKRCKSKKAIWASFEMGKIMWTTLDTGPNRWYNYFCWEDNFLSGLLRC